MNRVALLMGVVTVITSCSSVARGQGPVPPEGQGRGRVVVHTPHNLSTSGPSVLRAATEEQICIFCHSTHLAMPVQPLWNRQMPLTSYIPYSSQALDAKPGQPTGTSKLCLSCHDGTIALGNVVSRRQIVQMARGVMTIPHGSSNLGTDLSDDHPVSFRYDSDLATRDLKLVHPGALPETTPLDINRELQCTTCHDVHDNTNGDFLRMTNLNSAMCLSCHQLSTTSITAHQECVTCHQSHSAPSGPYLLRREKISETCLRCHNGSHSGAANVNPDFRKPSVHDTDSVVDPPDAVPQHATCADCHNPHTMESGRGSAPQIHPSFGQVAGVNSAGSPVSAARFEYEVCYRCHAEDNAIRVPHVPRSIVQLNTRLEFSGSAISAHPIEAPGGNAEAPSLRPPWTTSSMVYCSDCHGAQLQRLAGPVSPAGVHGSNHRPLLVARYETSDFTSESANAYALCYECHYRDGSNGILQDRSFPHRTHVVDNRTPCSACHDAHGISSVQGTAMGNTHLINFDSTVVFPHPTNGRLEFRDAGTFAGSCTLTCHGVVHDDHDYAN
jgi:predicted CXXCH cytochrome family protein